jgi:rod shape-determining protein MreB and related proteins
VISRKIAVDLGTTNSIVYVLDKGIVLEEPTVVAMSVDDDRIIAVGSDAKEMLGKSPEDIFIMYPLRGGVVADYTAAKALLRYFIDKSTGRSRIFKPDVVISIPVVATSVEARAVIDAAYAAGAREVYLVPGSLAAAMGAGLPISEPSGNMIVNLGGGTTEIAVASLYGLVVKGGVRIGGTNLDEAIMQHLRRKHGLVIGEATAESVKCGVGAASPLLKSKTLEVKGRDAISGFPKIATVTSEEVVHCISYPISQISLAIKNVLEQTPPELASDIVDKGIVLSGGTSLLTNIDQYIAEYTGVAAHIADEPILCVIKGLGMIMKHLDVFDKNLIKR